MAVAIEDKEEEYDGSVASEDSDYLDPGEELLDRKDSTKNVGEEADGTAASQEDNAEHAGVRTKGEDSNNTAGDVPGLLKGNHVMVITGVRKSFLELQQEEYELLYKSLGSYGVSRQEKCKTLRFELKGLQEARRSIDEKMALIERQLKAERRAKKEVERIIARNYHSSGISRELREAFDNFASPWIRYLVSVADFQ